MPTGAGGWRLRAHRGLRFHSAQHLSGECEIRLRPLRGLVEMEHGDAVRRRLGEPHVARQFQFKALAFVVVGERRAVVPDVVVEELRRGGERETRIGGTLLLRAASRCGR